MTTNYDLFAGAELSRQLDARVVGAGRAARGSAASALDDDGEALVAGLLVDEPAPRLDESVLRVQMGVPMTLRSSGGGTRDEVYGYRITIVIPVDGDTDLLRFQTSTTSPSPPDGAVLEGEVRLVLEGKSLLRIEDIEDLERSIRSAQDRFGLHIQSAQSAVRQCNERIHGCVRSAMTDRRRELDAARQLAERLGVPYTPD